MSGAPLGWLAALILCAAGLTTAAAQDVPADSPAYAIPCDELTELNSVYFVEGSAAFAAPAEGKRTMEERIAENAELLRRCPRVAARAYGYIERACGRRVLPAERDTALATQRAQKVRALLIEAEVGAAQIGRVQGVGVDAGVCLKGEQQTSRSRRADLIPLRDLLPEAGRRRELDSLVCGENMFSASIPAGRVERSETTSRVRMEFAYLLRRCKSASLFVCLDGATTSGSRFPDLEYFSALFWLRETASGYSTYDLYDDYDSLPASVPVCTDVRGAHPSLRVTVSTVEG